MLVEALQKLSFPEKENIVFLNPELSEWPLLLAENNLITNDLPNRPKPRRELLRIARDYTVRITDADCQNDTLENLIATGHQALWHHCGIWAKNLTTCKFAKAVGGRALHIVLDHDICDTAMVLPKQKMDGRWSFERIEIEPEQKAIPLEFRPSVQGDYTKTFVDTVKKARAGQFCNRIWSKCAVGKNAQISRLKSVAELITYLQSALNVALGLDSVMYLPVSKLSNSDAFISFVTSIILDARSFAASYNDGITRQIGERKINPKEIIRYLAVDEKEGSVELPFWLFLPDGRRESLHAMSKKTSDACFGTASTEIGRLDATRESGKSNQLKDMLGHLGYRLRPKAISLTLFARLFLADWFVHGVGGAIYEQVTDYIIENYYRIKPLRFGVATCTMTLPELNDVACHDGNRNTSQLKHKLHNIKHNPEKYIDKSVLKTKPVASLLRVKKERIAQAKDHSLPGSTRKSAWNSLFEINEQLFEYTKKTARALEKKVAQLERDVVSQQVCRYRKYFFGLFPEKTLRKLADSLTFTGQE